MSRTARLICSLRSPGRRDRQRRRDPKRPMSLEDLLGAVRVADPKVSPDGTKVIYHADDDGGGDGAEKCGHLDRARGRIRAAGAAHWRPQERQLRPVLARRQDRVHLESRWRIAGVCGRTRRHGRAGDHGALGRRAAAARDLSRRQARGLCLRRVSDVRRRGVQQTDARGPGRRSREGARTDAAAVPSLGRVARGGAPPRVRRGHRRRSAGARSHAGDNDAPPHNYEDAAFAFSRTAKNWRSSPSTSRRTPRCGRPITTCSSCR